MTRITFVIATALSLIFTQLSAQESMMSNGRYMPAGFCLGVIEMANVGIPIVAQNTAIAEQMPTELFSSDETELIKIRAIDLAKYEGSYVNWDSDRENGLSHIMSFIEDRVNTPRAALLREMMDKLRSCYETLAPQ